MPETTQDVWTLYLEALREAFLVPPGDGFLALPQATAVALNTATVLVPPVPAGVALAEVFRLGNRMPAWDSYYRPTAGEVFGQYGAYVAAILDESAAVQKAERLLRQVRRQVREGSGPLVMAVTHEAGGSVVPRFDPGPLGNPGYSAWLDGAIEAAARKVPPRIVVTVDGAAARPALARAAVTAPPTSLTLTIQSITSLPLSPGGWFDGSLLSRYRRPEQFLPGTAFHDQPIWGPAGSFNLIPATLFLGFRPAVELAFASAADAAAFRRAAAAGFAVGPFAFTAPAPAELEAAVVTAADPSLDGSLLALGAAHPNWPPVVSSTSIPGKEKTMRKTLLPLTLLLALAGLAGLGCQSVTPPPAPATPAAESAAPLAECDVAAGVQQCCSARKCTGTVLSNRDAHNCKNTGGKSWHNADGACLNL